MAYRYDIDVDLTYIAQQNDLKWVQSDMQHIEDTIAASQGEWKENPSDGVAISNYLNSAGQQDKLARITMIQLQKDMYNCNNPIVTYAPDGTLTLNPNIEL